MIKVIVPFLLSLIISCGCQKSKTKSTESGSRGIPAIEGVWEYPGGETKAMRMLFKQGGQLIFQEGFEFHNPASWSYNADLEELKLIVTLPKDYDFTLLKYQLEEGRITGFDSTIGTIGYKFTKGVQALDFGGWIYFKIDSVEAAQPAATPDASRRSSAQRSPGWNGSF
ncbi:MAG TPA: hypothetical protein VI932_05830 [Bacteroidota bacterium]|nr:hypothetical protein [Bacteroidota bacterium]